MKRALGLTLAALAATVALPAPAAQAGGRLGPYQIDKYAVPAARSGIPKWVKTWWTSKSDVCDVRVTVSGDGVSVSYPTNTGTYTSLRRSGNLARDDVDYTAFLVRATSATTRYLTLKTEVSYTKLAAGTLRPGSTADVPCTGPRSHRTTRTRLLVLAA